MESQKKELSKTEAQIISDNSINTKNQLTLDYSPPDTKLKKSIYFFDGNKMPNQVVATKIDPTEYLSKGKQVPISTVKQFNSLIGKNLSFT